MHDLLQRMHQEGLLAASELLALRRTCRDLRENPVRVLRSLNIASPEEIQGLLARYFRTSTVTDELVDALDESSKALIPIDLALHLSVLPIAEENGRLFVALEDPSDKSVLHQLAFFLDRRIDPAAATAHQIAKGLHKLYGLNPDQLKLSTVLEISRGVVGGVPEPEAVSQRMALAHSGSSAPDAWDMPSSLADVEEKHWKSPTELTPEEETYSAQLASNLVEDLMIARGDPEPNDPEGHSAISALHRLGDDGDSFSMSSSSPENSLDSDVQDIESPEEGILGDVTDVDLMDEALSPLDETGVSPVPEPSGDDEETVDLDRVIPEDSADENNENANESLSTFVDPDVSRRVAEAVNLALLRISLSGRADKGLEFLNLRLSPLGITVTHGLEPHAFDVEFRGHARTLGVSSDALPSTQADPLGALLLPALKALSKLKP